MQCGKIGEQRTPEFTQDSAQSGNCSEEWTVSVCFWLGFPCFSCSVMNKAVILKCFQRLCFMMQHRKGPAHRALAVGVPGDGRSPAALSHPSSQCWICAPAGHVCACSFPTHTCRQCPWTQHLHFWAEHMLQWHWAHCHWEREGILPLALSRCAGGAGGHTQEMRVWTGLEGSQLSLLPQGHLLCRRAARGLRVGSAFWALLQSRKAEYERHRLHWVAELSHRKCWS